jgi:hypothetical protein
VLLLLLIFVAGIAVGGVVGVVLGCLAAIAAAVILYQTCRVLEAKRKGRDELVMLGGGMTARVSPPPLAPTTASWCVASCRSSRYCRDWSRHRIRRVRRRHGGL